MREDPIPVPVRGPNSSQISGSDPRSAGSRNIVPGVNALVGIIG